MKNKGVTHGCASAVDQVSSCRVFLTNLKEEVMMKKLMVFRVLLALSVLFGFRVIPAVAAGIPLWVDGFEGNWQDC